MTPFPPSHVSRLLALALCAAALMVGGCDKSTTTPAAGAPPAAAPAPAGAPAVAPAPAPVVAPAPTAYTPPSADQLYEMVAPIALYPDKLVAQVLAGATYPAQVTAADQWLAQNAALKGGPLADAAEQQPWDASVKSLTAFRPVLDQMAKNLPWTTALGEAYYNDPDDVMNAIQVMRQRASKAGKLQSTTRLRVATAAAPPDYTPDPNAPLLYAGPPIIVPPPQFITIEPAQPDVVYVPAYDPQQFYGDPVAIYPGYVYSPPAYATAGVLGFGVGVVVGAALERHDWGWHAWGVHWGRPEAARGGARAQAAFDRPAVVYNRSTYISRSNTVVTNRVRNTTVVNGADPRQVQALQAQERQQQTQLEQLRRQQTQQGQRAQAQAQAPQAMVQQQAQQHRMPQRQQQRSPQRQEDASHRAQTQQLQQAQQHQARQQQQQQQQQQSQQHAQAQAQQARNQRAQAQPPAHQQQQPQQQPQQRQQQQMQGQARQQYQQAQQQQHQQVQQQRQQQVQAQRQAQAQRPVQAQGHAPHAEQQQHEGGGRAAGQHGAGERNQNR